VRARAGYADARVEGVEHGRREHARGRGRVGGLDRQRPGILEGPSRSGVRLGARVRQRPLARRGRTENGVAGREEGEEVELLDGGCCRACCDVRGWRGHGTSGWHEVRSL